MTQDDPSATMTNEVVEGFRLAPRQWRLWQLQNGDPIYRAQCVIGLEGAVNCELLEHALGQIVQRHGNALVTLGQPNRESYSDLFCGPINGRCRVELLREGDSIAIGAPHDAGRIDPA